MEGNCELARARAMMRAGEGESSGWEGIKRLGAGRMWRGEARDGYMEGVTVAAPTSPMALQPPEDARVLPATLARG